MRNALFLAAALAAAAAAGPASAAPGWREPGGDPGTETARQVYRDNLVGCLSRLRACNRDRLSREDRDYLVYEMRDQRFDADTVRQVADVRMTVYGGPVALVQGRGTGTRYPQARPEPARASSDQGGSGIIGLGKGLADIGGELVRQIAAPSR